MAVNRTIQPFYDTSTSEYQDKNYRQVLFTSGRAVQCRELTGIGNYATEHIKEVANLIYKDGTIISGCNIKSIDRTEHTNHEDALSGLSVGLITLNEGKIFADGYPFQIEFTKFPDYSKDTIPIRLSGEETIYVEILDTVVTAVEDSSLLDPASGYDNYEAPGAHRLQRIARYISTAHKDYNVTGNIRIPIATLTDGKVTSELASSGITNESSSSVSSETNFLDVISQRTFETSGNYLVNGFKVKTADSPDNTKIGVYVSPGVAYIGGSRIEMNNAFTGYIDKVMVTSTIQGEEHSVEYNTTIDSNGDTVTDTSSVSHRYKLNSTPVSAIDSVAVPLVGKKQLTYNAAAISYISGMGGAVNKILKCYVPTSAEPGEGYPDQLPATYEEFTEGVDFRFTNQGIQWLSTSSSKNPMSLPEGIRGTTFYVTFLYKPNLTASQYSVEYSSKREATLRLPIINGVATIPSEFYNPTIKSVKNPYVTATNSSGETDYAELKDNTQFYKSGNKVYVATTSYPTIPIRVTRNSNSSIDSIGVSGATVKTVKLYSESGTVYYRLDSSIEANPDYRFTSSSGQIEWLSNENRPSYGEVYLVEASLAEGTCIDFGSNTPAIVVNFTYENLSNTYTNDCHDSYLIISDSVKLARSEEGGDNITLSYEIARSRTTSVGLDSTGNIAFYHGTILDQHNNLTPVIPSSSLIIADLFIKPTTCDTYTITSYENYRMRMTDLRNMFERLKDVEYNIALNELETEAETKMAGSILRGVFTDSFTTIKRMDNSLVWSFIKSPYNQAIPLITEGILLPNFKKTLIDLKVNQDNTTAGLFDNVYLMSKNYGKEVWLRQPYGTTYRSAAEGLDLMDCFPSFSIDPDNDQFIEYEEQGLQYDSSDTINCYVFKGDSASLISAGNMGFPTTKNSVVTVQFWMYMDTNNNCMPFSFNGTTSTSSQAVNIMSTNKYFGFNTYNSDINGLPNEELVGYWRAYTFKFKCQGDKNTATEIYINGEKQNNKTYALSTGGAYNAAKMIFGTKFRISGSFYTKNGYDFKGKIADIRIWNRALTEDEIKDSLGNQLTGSESGLIGWWHTPITSDGVIVDSCANGTKHNLVVTGNGGYSSNATGEITTETRSFAKMVAGSDIPASSVTIKNIVDLTTGDIPDTQTEIVLDPTKSAISGTGKYVTQNANLGDSTGKGGEVKYQYANYLWSSGSRINDTTNSYNAYNVVETYYEKVTTQTEEILGEFVTDISSLSTLRRRIITVQGQGFLPDTDLVNITFDGIPVSLYKLNDYNEATDGAPSSYGEVSDRYWKTTSNGTFRCGFIIPDNIPIGVREVVLRAPGNIELKASYWGAGIKASKLTLTQTNETITWEPRTQIIGQQYMNKEGWILLDGWSCRSRCGTTPLCQTFYVNDSSLTKPVINDIGVNSDVFLQSVDVYFRTPGECIDCIAGFVELTDSGVPRSDSGAGPSRFVGGVKVFDSATINTTNGDPSRGTAAHNISWENLVQLKGGLGYGFIIGSTDGNTTLWTASIENSSKNTDIATGVSVISEPDRGILLSSPNGQTWTTYVYEDLKYTFYVANFFNDPKLVTAPTSMCPSAAFSTTGKVSYIEYDPIDIQEESGDSMSAMNFFIFDVNAQNSNDGSGFVVYQYSAYDETFSTWSDWQAFTASSTVYLSNSIRRIKIRIAMYSYNPYSSPIVSKDACLTCGQFVLPATYTSTTGTVGTWNKAEIYIDKFFDENLSNVDLYVSPDQGFSWRKMETPEDLTPVTTYSSRYNGEPINQYHYKMALTVQTPVLESITVTTNGNAGDFQNAVGDWEFAVALVDAQGNESELSNTITKTITSTNTNLEFSVKFDPNATGFRIYARLTTQDKLYLFYDSTASAPLAADLPNSTVTQNVVLGEYGAAFPTSGTVLIDNEYITYNGITKNVDTDGNITYTLAVTARNATHNGRISVVGAHTEGTEVLMMNEGYLQQDSPTPCVSEIWRFPAYSVDSNYNWRFSFTAKNALYPLRDTDLLGVNPHYDEDVPANYTSETLNFRVELSDKTGATTVDTLDKLCSAGRFMATLGYEGF